MKVEMFGSDSEFIGVMPDNLSNPEKSVLFSLGEEKVLVTMVNNKKVTVECKGGKEWKMNN
jgi:hypothetical protein